MLRVYDEGTARHSQRQWVSFAKPRLTFRVKENHTDIILLALLKTP